MNLTDDRTWRTVKRWLVGATTAGVYSVGFGTTAALYLAHLDPSHVGEDYHYLAATFWPVALAGGLATWYPLPTIVGFSVLIGPAVLVLRHVRQKQLAAAATEDILRDAGL